MSNTKDNFHGFHYVVEMEKAQPICFGSKVPRNTNPIGKGLSPFQKRIANELFTETGPGRYNTENITSSVYQQLNKIRSKKGIGSMVGNDKRFKEVFVKVPSPCAYELVSKWGSRKQVLAPFGSKSKQRDMIIDNNPGPGTYNLWSKKCRKTRFMFNFGKPSMIPVVDAYCLPTPYDTCHKCNTICENDYWQKDNTLFLCHMCWLEEKYTQEIYNEKELKEYCKIRNCSYMHQHEGTTAAIRILPPNKIKKKLRMENYLDLYIKC